MDRLTKSAYFLSNSETVRANKLEHILILEGFIDVNIVSDWDSKFTTFLESFRRNLGQRSTGIQLIISIQMVSQRELFMLKGHAQICVL